MKSFKTVLLYAALAIPIGEQVGTLPKGRFMVSFMTLLGSVASQYSTTGTNQVITQQFNRNITFSQMVAEDPVRGPQIQGLLQAGGVEDMNSELGGYKGRFEGSLQAMIPLIGYGITDRLGVFLTAPILKVRTQFTAAFEPSPQFESTARTWQLNGQVALTNNIYGALQTGFEQKIRSAGYRYEPDSERTTLGDLQVLSPLMLSSSLHAPLQWGVMNMLVLPTGEVARTDDLYGIGVGNGRVTAGSSLMASYTGVRDFRFAGNVGAALMFPTQLAKRIPMSADDYLPVDLDPAVRVATSAAFKLGLEARYQLSRSWSTRLGYQYQLELASSMSGAAFDQSRYDLLRDRSGQSLHTVSVGLDLSLIQAFLDGDVYFPMQLGIAASLPLAGFNTLADPTCLVQASFFF